MLAVSFVPTAQAAFSYTFTGPYNEVTGGIDNYTELGGYPISVIVSVYFPSGAPLYTQFYLGSNAFYNATDFSTTITPAVKPIRFEIDVANHTSTGAAFHREYYLGPNENSGNYSIYIPERLTEINTYIISFMDQVGILKTQPYISIQKFVEGAYHTVEQRLVDVQNIVLADLQEGISYHILLGDGTTWTTYGDLTVTSTTGIQLIIRGVDFPKETLLLYQYVHASAIRDFLNPIGAITVSYEDTTSQTTSVTVTIKNNGTTVYSNVFVAQTFSVTWNSAVNATTYDVTVAIVHANFGSFNYKYYMLGEYAKASEPFSLAFLGSTMGISTAVLIPALLIIFVAGCFSEITAEMAAVLTVIIAIILSALGWIEISQAAIITALALSVLAGIVTAKRRMSVY